MERLVPVYQKKKKKNPRLKSFIGGKIKKKKKKGSWGEEFLKHLK